MMHYSKECQKGTFEAGLCGCFADCSSCCYGWCCYPCALSQAWADVRGESCACCHFYSYEIFIKSNIRHVRGMQQDFCTDWCANLCCPCCALIQDMREIQFINAESRSGGSPNIIINYTSSSSSLINNQGPPQNPYGIPPSYSNQAPPSIPGSSYPDQPYVPPVYPPSQNYPNQPYLPQNYPSPQLYASPQFADDSKPDGNTPSDQS